MEQLGGRFNYGWKEWTRQELQTVIDYDLDPDHIHLVALRAGDLTQPCKQESRFLIADYLRHQSQFPSIVPCVQHNNTRHTKRVPVPSGPHRGACESHHLTTLNRISTSTRAGEISVHSRMRAKILSGEPTAAACAMLSPSSP